MFKVAYYFDDEDDDGKCAIVKVPMGYTNPFLMEDVCDAPFVYICYSVDITREEVYDTLRLEKYSKTPFDPDFSDKDREFTYATINIQPVNPDDIETIYFWCDFFSYSKRKVYYPDFAKLNGITLDVVDWVSKNPNNIRYIQNPSDTLQSIAISKNPSNIRWSQNPSESLQKIAVSRDGSAIRWIQNPTFEVAFEAVKKDCFNIYWIKNQTDNHMKILQDTAKQSKLWKEPNKDNTIISFWKAHTRPW